MHPFDLSDQVALVTGGNGGIGLGIAQGLAAAGAAVMIAGRDHRKSHAVVEAMRRGGLVADAVEADVTDELSCRAMVDVTVQRFARLDILVNNAGIFVGGRPEDMAVADWNKVLSTNLTSAFIASQAAYPHMKRLGGGKIINVGSMYSIFGGSTVQAYGASKGGVLQLTKSLAVAWAAENIQVNAVLPGFIDTDMSRPEGVWDERFHDAVLGRTPARRWGTPQDLAGVAVFLASAASNFVTGAAIPVDGGFAALGLG